MDTGSVDRASPEPNRVYEGTGAGRVFMGRIRGGFITLNNPSEPELEALEAMLRDDNVRCMIACKEHWTGGGTPHVHAIFKFNGQITDCERWRRRSGLMRACVEPIRGSWDQAVEYIRKEGNDAEGNPRVAHRDDWGEDVWFEKLDNVPHQGKRSDIDPIAEALADGATPADIAKQFPVQHIKYHRGIEANFACRQVHRRLDGMPRVLTLFGVSGSGKSRAAHLVCGETSRMVKCPSTGAWWDGYQEEDMIVLEEFRGQLTKAAFFRLVDRYSAPLQVKGAVKKCQAKTFVVCSPVHPSNWWTWDGVTQEGDGDLESQLRRRLTENPESMIVNCSPDGEVGLPRVETYERVPETRTLPDCWKELLEIWPDMMFQAEDGLTGPT